MSDAPNLGHAGSEPEIDRRRTYAAVIILNDPRADNGSGEAIQAELVDWVFAQ